MRVHNERGEMSNRAGTEGEPYWPSCGCRWRRSLLIIRDRSWHVEPTALWLSVPLSARYNPLLLPFALCFLSWARPGKRCEMPFPVTFRFSSFWAVPGSNFSFLFSLHCYMQLISSPWAFLFNFDSQLVLRFRSLFSDSNYMLLCPNLIWPAFLFLASH